MRLDRESPSWIQEIRGSLLKPQIFDHQVTGGLSKISVFWVSMVAFQRFAGLINVHAGLPFPVTALCGLSIVTTSHFLCSAFGPSVNTMIHGKSPTSPDVPPLPVLIKSSIFTSFCFAAIGRSFFRTALPSSIISKGAFARNSASVLATSDIATFTQRAIIQRLGVKHGCHQCGDKQILRQLYRTGLEKAPKALQHLAGAKGFIADHMPPTLFVNKAMKSWWFRTLQPVFPLKQRLYPQCQTCFSQQGSHVKSGKHLMIYFHRLRPVHISPLLADYIVNSDLGAGIGDDAVRFVLPSVQNLLSIVKDLRKE